MSAEDFAKCVSYIDLLQKQAMLVRQLEEELRLRMRGPSLEMQQQMEVLYAENEHLTREVAILRETIKVRYPTINIKILGTSIVPTNKINQFVTLLNHSIILLRYVLLI